MTLRNICLLGALCAATGPAWSDPLVEEQGQSSVTISQEDGAVLTRTLNHRYDIGIVLEDGSGAPSLSRMLVSIDIDRTIRDAEDQETETLNSTIHATARAIGSDGLGTATLDITVPGDQAAISGPFLITTTWGCCALQASHAVYSLKSGMRLFRATGSGEYGDWITLASSRRPDQSRYAAAFIAPTLSDGDELGDDKVRVGAIAYARETGPIQRLVLTAAVGRDSDEVLNWSPSLLWVDAEAPEGTDHVFVASEAPPEETYDGITLRLQLSETVRIDVPLEKDRLDIAKAALPEGFGLTEAPAQ